MRADDPITVAVGFGALRRFLQAERDRGVTDLDWLLAGLDPEAGEPEAWARWTRAVAAESG